MLQELVSEYGYVALFILTFFEGETIMLLSAYAAHQGYLDIRLVLLIGFLGTFAGDQLWFFVGRKWGPQIIQRFPSWKAPTEKAFVLLNKYDTYFILSFRFFYGIRNVTPVVIGMARVPIWRYFFLNMTAAIIWALAFGLSGYGFGVVIKEYFASLKSFELYIFGGLIALGGIIWLIHTFRRLRRARLAKLQAEAGQPPSTVSETQR
jgi:membrane protein DedA with SNARE-associated domain